MKVACDFCFLANPKAVGTIELSEDNFLRVMPILKKYLQSGKDNSDLELHALDAAQLLIHEMKHPRGWNFSQLFYVRFLFSNLINMMSHWK